MKFEVKGTVLFKAIGTLKKVIPNPTSTVLVVEKNLVYVFVTDQNISAKVELEGAKVSETGTIIMDFELLNSSIRNTTANVTVFLHKGLIRTEGGGSKTETTPIMIEDVPAPKLKPPKNGLDFSDDMVVMLNNVVPLVTVVDSKLGQEIPMNFRFDGKQVTMASASFIEAAFARVKVKSKNDMEFSLAAKIFALIKRMAGAKGSYSIKFNESFMYVEIPSENLVARFPSYQQTELTMEQMTSLFEKTEKLTEVRVNTKALLDAVSGRDAFITSESITLDLKVEKQGLVLSMHGDKGNFETGVDALEKVKLYGSTHHFFPIMFVNMLDRLKKATELTLKFGNGRLLVEADIDGYAVKSLLIEVG